MRRIPILFLISDTTSLLGNSIIAVALPWLVLIRTGDVTAAGIVAGVTAIPAFLAAIVGGALIDRVGRRRMSIIADLGSAVSVALLAVVDLTIGLDLVWFIILGTLGALADAPGMTARESLISEVAKAGKMSIDKLAGIREGLFGLSFLVGPAIAGIALTVLPANLVIWATAACSALAALFTYLLPKTLGATLPRETEEPVELEPKPVQKSPFWKTFTLDLVEGGKALLQSKVILALTILSTGSIVIFGPLQAIILPAHFNVLNAPDQLGGTLSALAIGSVVGSIIYATSAKRLSRRFFYVSCLVLSGLGLVLFAFLPDFWLTALAMVILGVGSGLLGPLVPVLVAEQIAENVRGRVLGLQNAAVLAASPLGMFVIGVVAGQFGLATATWTIAISWIIISIFALASRALKDLEAKTEEIPTL